MNKSEKDIVVLLHGIGHCALNMLGMEYSLNRSGYDVLNLSYPSTRKEISYLAKDIESMLDAKNIWSRGGKVHFVCHSLGGLVTRQYLAQIESRLPSGKLRRVIMLGTPNGGSEVADYLQKVPLYRWGFGPAGQELVMAMREQENASVFYDLGIVAGTAGRTYFLTNWFVPWRHDVHDGRVTTKSTRLQGMKDYIELPVSHGLLAWTPSVQKQIIYFIQNGVFQRESS
jgi:pimeloyl-ACP methyl ester carboxylesterase